jgi:carboxymethylenebutenolidase
MPTSLRDQDLLLDRPYAEFGSGVIGVCDICGKRQAVIVLSRERYKLCVIDFLNKAWLKSTAQPGSPLPAYRSESVWVPFAGVPDGRFPAVLLSPTKVARRPVVLITPEIYGLTTTLLDAGIRFARAGFEVLLPDLGKTSGVGPRDHVALRWGAAMRGGVPVDHPRVRRLLNLFDEAMTFLRERPMADPAKSAVFGASYGASLALAFAARDQKLGAVVAAYPLPIRPNESLSLITAPVLHIGGSRDARAARSRKELFDALRAKQVEVEFSIPSGAAHLFLARDMRAYNLTLAEDAWGRSVAFLRAKLMPPPPRPPTPPVKSAASAGPATPAASGASATRPGPVPATPAPPRPSTGASASATAARTAG